MARPTAPSTPDIAGPVVIKSSTIPFEEELNQKSLQHACYSDTVDRENFPGGFGCGHHMPLGAPE
jgi:hypothetical protein